MTRCLGGPVSHEQCLLHRRPAQVQIPIAEAQLLADFDVGFDRERRRVGRIEDPQAVALDVDGAGGEVGIGHPLGARLDLALDGQDELGADRVGLFVLLGIDVGSKHHLGEPPPISKIHENDAAMIAALRHPAHQRHTLADLLLAELAAVVCALPVAQCIGHRTSSFSSSLVRMLLYVRRSC